VDHGSAGEVERAELAQEAAVAPDPVRQRVVDQVVQSKAKRTKAENFFRSAKAPVMSAG